MAVPLPQASAVDGVAAFDAVEIEPVPPRDPLRKLALLRRFDGFGWALCGFLIGAVFWHLVGFWSFVSTVVLKGPEEIQAVAPGTMPSVANCTMLVLDRRHGGTRAEPCHFAPFKLEARSTGRSDRAVIALRSSVPRYQQWSTTLAPEHDSLASSQ